MNDVEKRRQVSAQCRAIVHLATNIALLHSDKAELFAAGTCDNLIEMVGRESARLMETLGDVLNGMDAVSAEDSWMNGIFERAQELWPS